MPVEILMPALSPTILPSSFRRKPESSWAYRLAAPLLWTPAFAGVTE